MHANEAVQGFGRDSNHGYIGVFGDKRLTGIGALGLRFL